MEGSIAKSRNKCCPSAAFPVGHFLSECWRTVRRNFAPAALSNHWERQANVYVGLSVNVLRLLRKDSKLAESDAGLGEREMSLRSRQGDWAVSNEVKSMILVARKEGGIMGRQWPERRNVTHYIQ